MNELEQGSLDYLAGRSCEPQWKDFLNALAAELNAQMPADELRAFFYVIGERIGNAQQVPVSDSLEQLQQALNNHFKSLGWGWMQIRDLHNSLEFVHSCAPLRAAFGDDAMEWCSALLEGMYGVWMRQLGAGQDLQLRQVGRAEGQVDTLRFRLAHPSLFT